MAARSSPSFAYHRRERGRKLHVTGDKCRGGLHVKSLVDYGKRKRIGEGHRRGGAARRGQRGSWSAADRRAGTSGSAVRRAGEARETGSARRSRRKSRRAVGNGYILAAGRSEESRTHM